MELGEWVGDQFTDYSDNRGLDNRSSIVVSKTQIHSADKKNVMNVIIFHSSRVKLLFKNTI